MSAASSPKKRVTAVSKTGSYAVPAVDRALSILELLSRHPSGRRMREIAEELGLPANSVFRITARLEERGYLQRDNADMRYRLTRKLISIGYAAMGEEKFVEQSVDIMQDLRDDTQETVLLGTRADTEGVVLECLAATQPLKFIVDAGVRFPLHTSAPGKAIVAFLPDHEQSTLTARLKYPAFNKRTLTSRRKFEAELKQVRTVGYSLDHAEEVEGIHCIGAPIFNHHNYPVAAIWITAPQFRLPEEKFPEVGKIVIKAAETISRRLGHKSSS